VSLIKKYTACIFLIWAFTAGYWQEGFSQAAFASGSSEAKSSDSGDSRIDLSAYTDARAMGFLATGKIHSAGTIKDSGNGAVLIGKGDRVYVKMNPGWTCSSNKSFTICRVSSKVRDPSSRDTLGFVVDFLGVLTLDGPSGQSECGALVKESFKPVAAGDFLLQTDHPAACIKPIASEGNITAQIAASKESMEILSQFSVIYLKGGASLGLAKGMVMQILEKSPKTSVIGHLVISDVYPESAVAVVVESIKEFHPWTIARGAGRKDIEYLLKKAFLCPAGKSR